MSYDNTNRGALFKNDRKESDSHPDLSGNINIDGKEYWLSGWYKKTETGAFKVLSLSVKPKEQRQQSGARAQQAKKQAFDPPADPGEFIDDDNFPF